MLSSLLQQLLFKMLGVNRYITSSSCASATLVTLYCALERSKLELISVAWNNVTVTHSSKIERVQRKFADLCYNIFLIWH